MAKRYKKAARQPQECALNVDASSAPPMTPESQQQKVTSSAEGRLPPAKAATWSWTHWIWLGIGLMGILVRVWLWWTSLGCNDIDNWVLHGRNVLANGLTRAYTASVIFNHPPFIGMYSGLAWSWADGNLMIFARLIKVPGLVGEAITLLVLWYFAGPRAFATYSWLPSAILISSFHGNTDTLSAAFILTGAIAFDRKSYLVSGILWSAALNVKLLPLVFVPLVLIGAPSVRALVRVSIGLAIGVLPFVPPALVASHAMYRNMLAYNSTPDNWGILALLNAAVGTPAIAASFTGIRQWYLDYGRYVMLCSIVSVALLSRVRRRLPMTEQAALSAALFLIFAPGFGIQYVVYPLPLLCFVDRPAAILWGFLSGIFLATHYWIFLLSWSPLRSFIQSYFVGPVPLLGMLAWAALVQIVWVHAIAAWRRTHGSLVPA